MAKASSHLTEEGSLSVNFVDKLTSICDWDVSVGRPNVDRSPPVSVRSPKFRHTQSTEWCIELIRTFDSFYVLLHLVSSRRDVDTELKFKVSSPNIFTASESVQLREGENCSFQFNVHGLCCHNHFKVRCEVTIPSDKLEPHSRSMLHTDPRSATADLETLHKPHSLSADFGALLDSGDLSDLVLCAGGAKLRAHRLLLSARSPVFKAMLSHDSQEAQTGQVKVEDIDPDTLQELLHYVYTGRAPAVRQMAKQLLIAGDKYGLMGLKELCEQELINHLTVDNAVATAIFSLRHSCDVLKPSVISFIKKNLVAVVATVGWADAIKEHTAFFIEISQLLVDKSAN